MTLGSTSRPATSQLPCLSRKPNARVATSMVFCMLSTFIVMKNNVLDANYSMLLAIEPNLFVMNTITLPEHEILAQW